MFNFNKKSKSKGKKTVKDIIWEWVETIVTAGLMALFIRAFFIQAYKIPTGSMEPTLIGAEQSKNHGPTTGDHLLAEKITYGILIPYTEIRLPKIHPPCRGDIVIFEYPYDTSKDYVKRAIGLPGDIIQIINKKVYINGKLLKEPWLKFGKRHWNTDYILSSEESTRDNFGPIIIPKKGDIIRFADNKIFINKKFIYNKKIISYYSRTSSMDYFYLYKKAITPTGENNIYKVKYNCYFMMGDNRDKSADSRFWGVLPYKYIKAKPLIIYFPFTRMGLPE